MEEFGAEWCEANPVAAAREIERLQSELRALREGDEVVLPDTRMHAQYMLSVARAYLEENDD